MRFDVDQADGLARWRALQSLKAFIDGRPVDGTVSLFGLIPFLDFHFKDPWDGDYDPRLEAARVRAFQNGPAWWIAQEVLPS